MNPLQQVICASVSIFAVISNTPVESQSRATPPVPPTVLKQYRLNEAAAICTSAQDPLRVVKRAGKLPESPIAFKQTGELCSKDIRRALITLDKLLSASTDTLKTSALSRWNRIGQVTAMLKKEAGEIESLINTGMKQKSDHQVLYKRLMTALNYLNELISELRDLDPTP